MQNRLSLSPLALFLNVLLSLTAASSAHASLLHWDWSYTAPGIVAVGTFDTQDTPDAAGFYLIAALSGNRNGVGIVGLQPTGTAIPGNEPFAVDNLVKVSGPQLTHNGFGFALSDGTYANPFYADFLATPSYLEFFSAPPFVGGAGSEDSELPIGFSARIVSVPEPASWATMLAGMALLGAAAKRNARPANSKA